MFAILLNIKQERRCFFGLWETIDPVQISIMYLRINNSDCLCVCLESLAKKKLENSVMTFKSSTKSTVNHLKT